MIPAAALPQLVASRTVCRWSSTPILNQGIDPNNNDITIQNCSGTLPNSVDPSCTVAVNSNLPSTMADGNIHTVTINYSGPATKLLDVILDNVDLFPGGVVFDLTTIGLNSGSAWVGFTAATGGGDDNQDILSWTFTPQAQTAVITTTAPAVLPFPNAAGTNVYDYTAQLTAQYPTPVVQVQPILMSQSACDAIVQPSFPGRPLLRIRQCGKFRLPRGRVVLGYVPYFPGRNLRIERPIRISSHNWARTSSSRDLRILTWFIRVFLAP